METRLSFTEIGISFASIILALGVAILIKKGFYKYKRPNGKKGGVVSLHVTLAFAIVAVIAMTTRDWFMTLITVILAYLIAKGRMDEGQHYLYQIILAAMIGLAVPYSVYYLYYRRVNPFASSNGGGGGEDRPPMESKPERAKDDRYEADREAPDMKLDDD